MIDTRRIQSVLEVATLAEKTVTIVGIGGGLFLALSLIHSGIRRFRIVDLDTVDDVNLCRQFFTQADIGRLKVEAAKEALLAVDPDAEIEIFPLDVTKLSEDEKKAIFAGSDLVLGLTDNHAAQSTTSRLAIQHGCEFMSVGIYPTGQGGEIFRMRQKDPACYREMFPHRFDQHESANAAGKSLDPTSDGAPISVGTLVDSIAIDIALGMLTTGADNRYGRLMEQLGDRQLLVVKIDPAWETSPGRDLIRDELGIDQENPFYVAYNTIAMSAASDSIAKPCHDCRKYRGGFVNVDSLPY